MSLNHPSPVFLTYDNHAPRSIPPHAQAGADPNGLHWIDGKALVHLATEGTTDADSGPSDAWAALLQALLADRRTAVNAQTGGVAVGCVKLSVSRGLLMV